MVVFSPSDLSSLPSTLGQAALIQVGTGFEHRDSQHCATETCFREDIFQVVTACPLGLAVPGESKCLHRCRRAGAETIRTVYKAKANCCQRVPVGSPRVNPCCAGINLSLALLLACSMATRSGCLLLPGSHLLGLLQQCLRYPLGCTSYRQSYMFIYGP